MADYNLQWKALAEMLLFDYGKSVLGKNAGGMIVKLLKDRGIDGARRAILAAQNKQDPREYVGAAINGHSEREVTIAIGEVMGRHKWTGSRWAEIEENAPGGS